ncbi:stage II sporulation protein D [Thermoflavimicrobium dichotomicum]|uniref:Stage II sporulation protein D n=1 Tax=Thermoflavimicrobium dichotomicum TaxID=46223 RepID=A0A1I3K0Q2_9BACL|nr:stage II sporulation protein D [Thermoflavimicrobium dichotomicum]SFI65994.1 stage II sporulation protein D [Thermoflavimicrobium dichotomicum]
MPKKLWLYLLILLGSMLVIPTILAFARSEETIKKQEIVNQKSSSPSVLVYLTKEKRVEKVPLEHYVQGVVAAEMPVDFHLEALKAQALVARTYIIHRLMQGALADMDKWGPLGKSAHVTDTVQHQSYKPEEILRREWGDHFKEKYGKIKKAVQETAGQVITYHGKPIYAAFFSTSNGKTENSEEYFNQYYPYLRSVDSAWDQKSPKFHSQKVITWSDFINQLAKKTNKGKSLSAFSSERSMRILHWTSGRRIAEIQIGNQRFTGRQIREAIQLPSSDFRWKVMGDRIVFTIYGYGHGVGMSQWGANLLAHRGKDVSEIINHYYQGVEIKKQADIAWLQR